MDRKVRDKLLAGEKVTIPWDDVKHMVADAVSLRCGLAASGNFFLVGVDRTTGEVAVTLENVAALKDRG